MKLKEIDFAYCIFYESKDRIIYDLNNYGFHNIFVYYPQIEKKELWLQEGFMRCWILCKSDDFCYVLLRDIDDRNIIIEIISKKIILDDFEWGGDFCVLSYCLEGDKKNFYLMLEDNTHQGFIVELFSKKIILRDFAYSDFGGKSDTKFSGYIKNFKKYRTIRFVNKSGNKYSLFSLTNGYIYGPVIFNKIEEYKYGVIIDDKTLVEDNGYIIDLTDFMKVINEERVYKNTKKEEYLFYLDEEGHVLVYMEQDQEKPSLWRAFSKKNECVFIYNSYTYSITSEYINEPSYDVWTERDTIDYAYEGHTDLYDID